MEYRHIPTFKQARPNATNTAEMLNKVMQIVNESRDINLSYLPEDLRELAKAKLSGKNKQEPIG